MANLDHVCLKNQSHYSLDVCGYVYMRTNNVIISNNQSKDLIALCLLLLFTCNFQLFAKNCG